MGLFNRKKKAEEASSSNGDGETGGQAEGPAAEAAGSDDGQPIQRDPKKAQRFFEYGQAVADSRNYDYAIECYVNGLRHDPEALEHHEALRDVALRRKVAGGKPAGMRDKWRHSGGKDEVERMLNAEFLWSKDPFNSTLALQTLDHAVKAGLEEVAYWVADLALEANRTAKRPSKHTYVKIRDKMSQIGAFDKAVEAGKAALAMDPDNMKMLDEMKNLEAELTLQTGRYGEEGADFRAGVRDAEKQRALEQDDAIAKTGSALDETINRQRAEYEDDPEDMEKLTKLVRSLTEKEDEEAEDEAMRRLQEAYERTGQYRFKAWVGDIRIKQFNRQLRELRQQMAKEQDEQKKQQLAEQIKKKANEQVRFELQEYEERVRNYPTDMGLRYQLGRRQFALGDYDAAIASLQEAQNDPKNRAWALRYLGEAFSRKGWYDEAVDTFHRGIEIHPYEDDKLALDLRYELMKVLEAKGRETNDAEAAQEASRVASQIAQADINYRDIRDRLENVRQLTAQLKGDGEDRDAASA